MSVLQRTVIRLASHLVGRTFESSLRDMQLARCLPPEELKQRSDAKLQPLLKHAIHNVPFYRGCQPNLTSLPVVSKATFRRHGLDAFLAQNLPEHRRLPWTTSGSTGEPFRFYHDREAQPYVYSSHVFYDTSFGLSSFDRYIRIMTPPVATVGPGAGAPFANRLREAVRTHLQHAYEKLTQERISVWEIDAQHAEQIYARLERFRPDYVLGYTSSLATIAGLLLQRDLRLTRKLKAVVTIAESLTPERRRLIEEYFQAPICNRWGQREFKFWSAQSCAEHPERFHINTELVVAEVLDEHGNAVPSGQLGRLVMTNLTNYVMPFLRYDTGDLAVLSAELCECGSTFPVISRLEGRSHECYRTRTGGVIHPVVLGQYLFVTHDFVDAIRQFQLIQEGADRARFLVVPGDGWDSASRRALSSSLHKLLGPETWIDVEVVDQIAVDPSGKRPIIKRAPAAHSGVDTESGLVAN